MSAPIRVVLADDHGVVRLGLRTLLSSAPDVEVVGEAADGAEALVLCDRLQPDIVVMDIQMPREDGLTATGRIRQVAPQAVVAVLTAHHSPEWVSRAAQAGASAFVPKNGSLQEMIDVLASLNRGHMVVAPSTFTTAPTADPVGEQPDLSQREIEVLQLLAQGTVMREMAPALGITVNTCRGYVKTIRQKLGATSQLEAVLKARQLGLIDD